jgi:hypothetical protein
VNCWIADQSSELTAHGCHGDVAAQETDETLDDVIQAPLFDSHVFGPLPPARA